jgi:surface polysaccharide O-acyltransferase-like enzyme
MIWLDAARVLAVAAVVLLHVSASVVTLAPLGSAAWWAGNGYDAAARWCVPVFVMVSGALLLDPRKAESLAGFYRKRAARVLLPIAFWSAVYILWNHRSAMGELRWTDALYSVARGWPHYHLWYLYMVACLYLFVPFLRTLVRHAQRHHLWMLVALMFVWSAIHECYRVFTGQEAGLFINWFLPFLPYFLCGHLIHTSERGMAATRLVAAWAAAVVATAAGCFWLGRAMGLDKGLYFYGYLSVSVIPMSLCAMLWLRAVRFEGAWARALQRMAPLTLGVYLVHPILLESFRDHVFKPEEHAPWATVPLVSALVLVAALAVGWIFHRTPFLRRVV